MTREQIKDAIEMATSVRHPRAGLLHHSDHGSQYASAEYQAVLQAGEMVASMSRTGNCYDNAAMESFFGTLKCEFIHDELPGTSVAGVYLENEADYARVERLLNDTLNVSLAEIAARLDTRGEGRMGGSVPVVVYNPLAWARSEPVRVMLRLNQKPSGLVVRNADGHEVPAQVYDVKLTTRQESASGETRSRLSCERANLGTDV